MSAINVAIGKDSLCMTTDTARLRLDGTFVDHVAKAVTLPHRQMVVAVRGWTGAIARLAAIVNAFPDYDTAVRDLPAELRRQYERSLWRGRFCLLAGFDLVVAGVTGKGEFRAFVIVNHKLHGIERFKPLEISGIGDALIIPPTPFDAHLSDLATTDHISAATQAIVAQRSVKCSGVGGFAVSTLITRNGIAQNAVATWNDTPGQKLDPKAEFKPLGVNNPKPLSLPKRHSPVNFMTAGNSGFTVQ